MDYYCHLVLKFLAIFALALFAGTDGKQSVRQTLDGTWIAKGTEFSYEFPASVPGGIYTDLMKLDMIDDVFYGYNDNSSRWVGNMNWTYALDFTVNQGLLDYENVNLVFEGVDTFATIVLNNVTIGETENMFVKYVFDVKDFLKDEGNNNTLKIFFANPVERVLNLHNEQQKDYKILPECPPEVSRGECHVNMARKMQASFSWDWGPSLPSMGLWKSVFLEAYDESVLRYGIPRLQDNNLDGDNYLFNIDFYLANNRRNNVLGNVTFKIHLDDDQSLYETYQVNETVNAYGEIVKSVSFLLGKDVLEPWFPNGYGGQRLYPLELTFTSGQDQADVNVKTLHIGARIVELVQEPLDSGGTFYLKVNGVPIFAKGSNEIPVNVLPELGQDPVTITSLLQSAKEANMNMLRVWGGGVYESDDFYDIADRLGIMIWQDFMFASSTYPAIEQFLSSVRAEVNHNVKRLFPHPSVVIYSGNNENEMVLADNVFGTADNIDQYKSDYVALYIDTIRAEFNRITGNASIFVSSSPSNGNLTESEGWVAENPGSQFWGDVHNYNYGGDSWDSNIYPVPRFCSEYGYQSLPFEDAWLTATNDTADLSVTSEFMSWRQHHAGGNGQMEQLIAANLQLPDSSSENYSSAFIYLSEVYTSQAIKVETEHYRRYRSYLTDDSRGYTMGALYWQLNDVWVAPTWSSIDYTGKWKMLHYFAKNFFSNVIVTGHINSARELQLYTVNDGLSAVENVTVLVRVYKYDSPSFAPVYENRLNVTLNASASQLIQTIQTDQFLTDQKCDSNSCFFHFVVQENNASSTGNIAIISPDNYVFPGKLKDSSLASPTVKIASVTQDQTNITYYDITLTSDNIALFVWLDSHSVRGQFSDNGFLQVENTRVVAFRSEIDTTEQELRDALTVTHLKDSRWA